MVALGTIFFFPLFKYCSVLGDFRVCFFLSNSCNYNSVTCLSQNRQQVCSCYYYCNNNTKVRAFFKMKPIVNHPFFASRKRQEQGWAGCHNLVISQFLQSSHKIHSSCPLTTCLEARQSSFMIWLINRVGWLITSKPTTRTPGIISSKQINVTQSPFAGIFPCTEESARKNFVQKNTIFLLDSEHNFMKISN